MFKKIKESLRKILRKLVKQLTRKIIEKHNISIIAILGHFGTDIAREALYSIISENGNVRRNTKPIWWDMSIPITILGGEDKKKSILEWNIFAFKSWIGYITNKSYPHQIIIELDTNYEDVADYWGDIIAPKAVLLVNVEQNEARQLEKIINNKEQVSIIYDVDDINSYSFIKNLKSQKTFSFGIDKASLNYRYDKKVLDYIYRSKSYKAKIDVPIFEVKPIVGAISTAIVLGVKPSNIPNRIENFELHPEIISKVINNIKL